MSLKTEEVHPPGFKKALQDRCIKCEALCVSACPEDIIISGRNGIPRLEFADKGCTFCGDCVDICPSGVLSAQSGEMKIAGTAEIIRSSCMAWNGVICNNCMDQCEPGAIKFEGMKNPRINQDLCTMCGMCLPVCPSDSIGFKGAGG